MPAKHATERWRFIRSVPVGSRSPFKAPAARGLGLALVSAHGPMGPDFKVVGRLRPLDLLGLVPGVVTRGARFRSLEKELAAAAPMPRAFDLFVELADAQRGRQTFQIEAEARPRSDTGKRIFNRWSYAHLVLGRPVECVVFYLMPAREGRRPQTRYSVKRGSTSVDFLFQAVCLWWQRADKLLEGETPGLWALIALAAGCRRKHVERACNLLEAIEDELLASELLGVWYEVAGVRFGSKDLQAIVSRKELLMESSTYRAVREEGRREGHKEGRKEELSKTCRLLVESKLGHLPPEAQGLEQITDLDALDRLRDRLFAAASPQAVRAALRSIKL